MARKTFVGDHCRANVKRNSPAQTWGSAYTLDAKPGCLHLGVLCDQRTAHTPGLFGVLGCFVRAEGRENKEPNVQTVHAKAPPRQEGNVTHSRIQMNKERLGYRPSGHEPSGGQAYKDRTQGLQDAREWAVSFYPLGDL